MLNTGEKVVRDLLAAIDAQDFENVASHLSSDFVLCVPGFGEGLNADGLMQGLKAHYKGFPDWVHAIDEVFIQGNKIAVKITQSGTHQGEYEGIPATLKKVTMAGMAIVTIEHGKVKEYWAVNDFLGLFTQLGMELKPRQL